MLTGGIDISLFGIGVLAGVVGASLMTARFDLNLIGDPVPMAVGLLVMVAVGLIMGAINGGIVAKLRVPALIVTLGTWQIGQGLAQIVGGGYTITELPPSLSVIGQGSLLGLPIPVIQMLVLFAIAYFVLHHTPFGRSVFAVGGNPASAFLSGIKVQRVQFLVFVISGLTVSLAAISIEARLMSVTTQTLSDLPIDTIAAVTIGGVSIYGGRGSVLGVLLGTLIIAVTDSGLGAMGASLDVKNTVKGAIILLAILAEHFRYRSRQNATATAAI
jgi:ribose/xylose/arabinose/galactoside ABC-type transport system permease subunit